MIEVPLHVPQAHALESGRMYDISQALLVQVPSSLLLSSLELSDTKVCEP